MGNLIVLNVVLKELYASLVRKRNFADAVAGGMKGNKKEYRA